MRSSNIRILICVFRFLFLLLTAINAKGTTISGHVTGNTEKQLKVFYPFNGFTTVWFLMQEKSLIALDSSNSFNVQFSITHPTFISLYIDYNPIHLFVSDSSNLIVEIHLDSIKKDSHKNWLSIEGEYARGNLYFNEYNFYPYTKYAGVIDFFSQLNDFKLPYLKKSIDSLVARETSHFDSLLAEKAIDSVFWNVVSKNMQALLYLEIIRHPLAAFDERKSMRVPDITALLDWLFSKCNPFDEDLLYGTNPTLYQKYFFLIKSLQQKNKRIYQRLDDSVITRNGRNYILTSYYSHLFQIANKTLQENYWAEELFSYQSVLKGTVTNNDVQLFKLYFPDSKWLPYLKATNDSILKVEANTYDSSQVHYIEKPKVHLQNMLNQFKGSALFIDLWASWCIPCRQEFAYNNAIDSILSRKNITRLYISIDIPSFIASWKSAIKEYNLKGYHLIAGQQMIKEIKTTFYFNQGPITIPRFILIDKEGKIINVDAPRPSDPSLGHLLESL